MKRVMMFAASVAALFTLASCQKGEFKTGDDHVTPVFTATIADYGTRTSIDASDGTVSWVDGDTITITDASKTKARFIASSIDKQGRATFTVVDGEPLIGDGPYKAVYGKDPSISQVYSDTVPALPMSAESNNTELTFTVSCGLLEAELTAAGGETTKDVKTVEILGTPTDGVATIYTLTCDQAQDISTPKKFYIALPAGTYSVMKFTNSTGHSCNKTATTAMVLEANTIESRTVEGIFFNDVLPGKFTTNSKGDQVQFSRGNLYYDGSAFKFEENQYSSASSRAASHVSHFYWSKSANVAVAESYSDAQALLSDVLFTNLNAFYPNTSFTVEGATYKWRTLCGGDGDQYEWYYLLLIRTVNGGTGEGKSFQRATIRSDVSGGVFGMIIYPDGYTAQTSATTYTSGQWNIMESAGCVFLPAAGYWTGNVYNPKNTLAEFGTQGHYWTSTFPNDIQNAVRLVFDSNGIECTNGRAYRGVGQSVRLVCAAQ